MRNADVHKGFHRARLRVRPVELIPFLPPGANGKPRTVYTRSTGTPYVGGDANLAQKIIDDYIRTVAEPEIEAAKARMRGEAPPPRWASMSRPRLDGTTEEIFFPHRLPTEFVVPEQPNAQPVKVNAIDESAAVFTEAEAMTDWRNQRGDNVVKQKAITPRETAMRHFWAIISKPDNLLGVTKKDAIAYSNSPGLSRHEWDEVHGLFGWAEKKQRFIDLPGGNPFAGVSGPVRRKKGTRKALTEPLARSILLGARACGDPVVEWGHDLCCSLGTITSEIADALVAHIVIDEDSGLLCLSITPENRKTILRDGTVQRLDRLKTLGRTRLLPIPNRLLTRFEARIAYIRREFGEHAALFPEVEPDRWGSRSTRVSNAMQALLRDKDGLDIQNVVDEDGFKTLVDSRSWRKRWINLLHKTNAIPGSDADRWRAMAGHGGEGVDVHAAFYLEHPPAETILILNAMPDPTIDKRQAA